MPLVCKHCEVEKDESLMVVRAGKPSLVCLDCKTKRGNGGGVKPRKKGGPL